MIEVYSKAIDKTLSVERMIDKLEGERKGPSIIFTGGIHGNEPSGVFALKQVLRELREKNVPVRGTIYALSGNMRALEKGKRFITQDLNRMWSIDQKLGMDKVNLTESNSEIKEQIEINKELQNILKKDKGPFYFMDLHTTSSQTIPFLTVNDSLLNRRFTKRYPVPIILGIEEYLDGPLLSHINELGYVAFGFEGGQHDDVAAIENHVAFIYLSLVYAGMVIKESIDFEHYKNTLAKTTVGTTGNYEIFHRHEVKPADQFQMEPGFVNFQAVTSSEKLATSNGEPLVAGKNCRVFMPLYQSQGTDGYFLIRQVPKFFMRMSAVLRRMKIDRIIAILPGVSWRGKGRGKLEVNLRVARFFTRNFFHLMGYRSQQLDEDRLLMKSRETSSREKEYKQEIWYKKSE